MVTVVNRAIDIRGGRVGGWRGEGTLRSTFTPKALHACVNVYNRFCRSVLQSDWFSKYSIGVKILANWCSLVIF